MDRFIPKRVNGFASLVPVAGIIFLLLGGTGVLVGCVTKNATALSQHWRLDGQLPFAESKVEGNPQQIPGDIPALYFDGRDDRIVVTRWVSPPRALLNPREFTIELLIKPDPAFTTSPEPRLFHLEDGDTAARRVTLELRLTPDGSWYLDTFIKADENRLTLADPSRRHPSGRWTQIALVYKNGTMTSVVDGKMELSGRIGFRPIGASGHFAIGSRLDGINWYKGAIAQIAVSDRALDSTAFLLTAPANR